MVGGKQQEGKKAGGSKKAGRSKRPGETAKRARGRDNTPVNKLKRVLRSNGGNEAVKWAEAQGAMSALRRLPRVMPGVTARAVVKSEAFRKAVSGKAS